MESCFYLANIVHENFLIGRNLEFKNVCQKGDPVNIDVERGKLFFFSAVLILKTLLLCKKRNWKSKRKQNNIATEVTLQKKTQTEWVVINYKKYTDGKIFRFR